MNLASIPKIQAEELLKRTTSRCPKCHASCPAEVWRVAGSPQKVFLKRTCPDHGEASVCIASDARFYWLAQGKPENACCAGGNCSSASSVPANSELLKSMAFSAADYSVAGTLGRNAAGRGDAPFEKLSTCLALIEIVNSCNLACPTCYADSPVGIAAKVDAVPLEQLKSRIQGVIDRKGGIEILQLSGGEPTLHPQFFELVEWAQANPNIDYLLLNTNGVRLATDEVFAERLGKTFHYGGMQLYLQFDGMQLEGQEQLRGGDLRGMRVRAIERCGAMNLPITLAMTVTPDNLSHLWEAVEFGLKYKHIRGISFQPMFTSGRLPKGATAISQPHLNTADIILAAVGQSSGKLRFEDFTPLPCGDPNCATIGYLLKVNGATHSISNFIDFTQVQGFLHDKVRYKLEDLMQCGCESEPLGELLKKFELDESNTFRLFIKPFMDAFTWDEDRIDRCCTHVIRPDGKLDSFCRYYSGFSDTKPAPQ
ncbi:radical SAM protein [Pedosphaera parvula]|uniref:Radical SAM domain protein n=1 Tax=Pedosphaera parvula (strain Ellin514) TaxID=320771 RepID=B9XBU7_PEDPL|nr:radical SAM protein [Pedosphaera parvula]EEF62415.1 Radical SAM domain protein [Pedosphaera parvula Ellin514]